LLRGSRSRLARSPARMATRVRAGIGCPPCARRHHGHGFAPPGLLRGAQPPADARAQRPGVAGLVRGSPLPAHHAFLCPARCACSRPERAPPLGPDRPPPAPGACRLSAVVARRPGRPSAGPAGCRAHRRGRPSLDGDGRRQGGRNRGMKGVILAGGSGTRLHPLTRITNKHLLPIYDRPMVTYAIEALVKAGITEIMVVTGGTHAGEFLRLLGNGHEYGIDRLFYAYQERPGGIAEALGLAERFVEGDRVVVMLADNVVERSLRPAVTNFLDQDKGARILLSPVEEAVHLRHLGVPELDDEGRVVRLFVPGGAGFIGSNYVHHVLATSDDEVTVYDALTYAGNLDNLRDVEDDGRYRFVKGDITDRAAVEEAMAGHDAVVHFAAESHVDRSIVSPDEFVHTNCDGTNVIMDVARRTDVERVLHVSTDEVYGSIAEGSFRETDALGPRSPYSASKAGSDLIAMSY